MADTLLTDAARVIRREAESIRCSEQSFNSATRRWRWPAYTRTNGVKASYDEMIDIARQLEARASGDGAA